MLQVLNNTSADVYSPRSNWALDDTSVPPRRFEVSPQVSAGPNERVDGDDDQTRQSRNTWLCCVHNAPDGRPGRVPLSQA